MTTLVLRRDAVVKTITAAAADPYFAAMPADAGTVRHVRGDPAGGRRPAARRPVRSRDGASGTEVRHAWIPGPTLLELPGLAVSRVPRGRDVRRPLGARPGALPARGSTRTWRTS